jgi:NAD(P)-dependent dehydrogenase (short-subunit alcohol dehydrogenase family)
LELHGIDGKIIIITGSGRGLGKAAAMALASNGAKVIIVSRTESDVRNTVKEIKSNGNEALGIITDITKENEVKSMVEEVIERYGTVDVLINNAAVSFRKSLIDTTPDDWNRLMAVNLGGMYLCTREVLPTMLKKKSGKIINVSSRSGSQPYEEHSAYCTSKYGVIGFTECMAMELSRDNIYVNCVSPDRVITKMSTSNCKGEDFNHWFKSEDLAHVFVFLVSDEAKTINGANINAYGFAAFGLAGFGTMGWK